MQVLEKILKEIDVTIGRYKEIANMEAVDICYGMKVAKKIIRQHINDGWVSVEERLPENDGIYIATMDGEIVGQKIPFTGLAEFENGKWVDDEDDYNCVIAWRPLPEPYRPERSEK